MKKLSLLLGGVILSTAVMAQKPTEGAPMSLEGQVGLQSGVAGGNILQFTAPSIRFRYFVMNNLAIRATLGIDNAKQTKTYYENADFSGATGTVASSVNGWRGAIGAEYHFTGTNRLSPYAGLDIRFGGGNTREVGKNVTTAPAYSGTDKYETNAKYGTFGVGLVAGTDFYFAENFYLGLELGLGWASTTNKQDSYSVTTGGTTTTGKSDGLDKTSVLSTNATALFRLGWRF